MVKNRTFLIQYYLRLFDIANIAFSTEKQGLHEEKFIIFVKKGEFENQMCQVHRF